MISKLLKSVNGANDHSNLISWLKLARTPEVSSAMFFELINVFGSSEAALKNLDSMASSGGSKKKLAIPSDAEIELEISNTKRFDASMICAFEERYPKELIMISNPPPVLTVKGRIELLSAAKKIAIVGARNASLNGIKMAETLASELSNAGYVIVSGLARGIDEAAQRVSIKNGTIGVIAGGIDNIYPRENTELFKRLYKDGLVITEHKIGAGALPQNFSKRNRIISGLSAGVVVVEAAKRSGTLITARFAAEQGREVFAVPGSPFDIRCSGTNALIKNGASLIEKAEDIISELESDRYNLLSFKEKNLKFDSMTNSSKIPSDAELAKYRKKIFQLIPFNPISVYDIANYTEVDLLIVNYIILELELAGKISRVYGNNVVRIP